MTTQPLFNDHNAATADEPLTIDSSQFLQMQFNSNDFEIVEGELKLKVSAGNVAIDNFIAGEVIPEAYRAVHVNAAGEAFLADSTDISQVDSVVGISLGPAGLGGQFAVQKFGRITNPAWSWTVGGGIFFDSSGILTQTVPTTGYWMNVAKVINPAEIEVLLRLPVIRVSP